MLSTICKLVVPLGFEPRSEEPESSMMDRYTKGLCLPLEHLVLETSGFSVVLRMVALLRVALLTRSDLVNRTHKHQIR